MLPTNYIVWQSWVIPNFRQLFAAPMWMLLTRGEEKYNKSLF